MPTIIDDNEITLRQKTMMMLIVEHLATDPLRQYPSQRELLAAMNERLPKQATGKPALVGIIQIARLAEQLRRLGLLLDISKMPDQQGRYRNLVPTAKGERLAKQWLKEATQK